MNFVKFIFVVLFVLFMVLVNIGCSNYYIVNKDTDISQEQLKDFAEEDKTAEEKFENTSPSQTEIIQDILDELANHFSAGAIFSEGSAIGDVPTFIISVADWRSHVDELTLAWEGNPNNLESWNKNVIDSKEFSIQISKQLPGYRLAWSSPFPGEPGAYILYLENGEVLYNFMDNRPE
jgi:hypothetical protein